MKIAVSYRFERRWTLEPLVVVRAARVGVVEGEVELVGECEAVVVRVAEVVALL